MELTCFALDKGRGTPPSLVHKPMGRSFSGSLAKTIHLVLITASDAVITKSVAKQHTGEWHMPTRNWYGGVEEQAETDGIITWCLLPRFDLLWGMFECADMADTKVSSKRISSKPRRRHLPIDYSLAPLCSQFCFSLKMPNNLMPAFVRGVGWCFLII